LFRKRDHDNSKLAAMQNREEVNYRKTNAFMLRHRQPIGCMLCPCLERREVSMTAAAEVLSTATPKRDARGIDLPDCPVCADTMVAAEASAYVSDDLVSYLWTCDTCGYGFVTKHALGRIVCN
jgi:hypothetical protein